MTGSIRPQVHSLKVHTITHNIVWHLVHLYVVKPLHPFCYEFQQPFEFLLHSPYLIQLLICLQHWLQVDWVYWEHWGVHILSVEGGHPCCCIHMVIEHKFGKQQPVCPVVLIVIDKGVQVHLQLLTCPLHLPICLWVVCYQQCLSNPQPLPHPFHIMCHKLRPSI